MASSTPDTALPVSETERIAALDVLRGFALLGILIMNVQAFTMHPASYTNPTAYGDLTGINAAVWSISHVIADQKFMSIFSMLFGAGVCLFSDRAVQRTGRSAGVYYRRTLILLAVGLAHAYLLFYGEILTHYGLCGLWVYLLRKKSPRTLVIIAAVLLLVPTALNVSMGLAIPNMPPEAIEGMAKGWAPPPDKISATVEALRGSYGEQVAVRFKNAVMLQTLVFVVYFGWRVTAMMLLGMALYKTGIITGERDDRLYRKLVTILLPVGLGLSSYGVWQNFAHDFEFAYSMFQGGLFNFWGSIAVALGYIGVIMLMVRRGVFVGLQDRLAAAGRMAFTNYIAHSVIAWIVFNELGLFGSVQRWQQPLFVVAVWVLQLWYSPLWLSRYRFGPLEWLWRSATYGRIAPLSR